MAVIDSSGLVHEAAVKDLTRHGCRIQMDRIWPIGTQMQIEFVSGRKRHSAGIVVRNLRRERLGGQWSMGVEFVLPRRRSIAAMEQQNERIAA